MIPYQLAVCGCGPASLSPLIYMEENGKLDELLQLGLCIVDESEYIGTGNIGKYHITANSLGKVFTEIFKNPESKLLAYLSKKESMKKLECFLDTAPPLTLVGELMNDIGQYLGLKVENSKTSDLFPASRVTKIKWRKDKQFDMTIEPLLNPQSRRIITSKHVLFNAGGMQQVPAFVPSEVRPEQQIWYSDSFLKGKYDDSAMNMINAKRPLKITLLGASHSAFSSLYRLQHQFQLLEHSHIHVELLTRKPIRLFYRSVEDAVQDSYPFDPIQDVCPLSGRVNRFSGLRYDSFQLAKEVLDNRYPNVNLQVIEDNVFDDKVNEQLLSTDILLVCTGYQNNTTRIVNERDEPLQFEITKQGTIYTDNNYSPLTKEGEIVQNLYTYGLGTGVKSSVENGGEPSFQAQVHGVWFYQHIVAPRVSDLIFK